MSATLEGGSRARLRAGVVCVTLVAVATASGACDGGSDGSGSKAAQWTSYGKNLRNHRYNRGEEELGPDNVGELERVWSFEGPGITSTPVVADGTVYVGGWDGNVYALDLDTGAVQWKTQLTGAVDASALIVDDKVCIGDGAGAFACLDRETGDIAWQKQLEEGNAAHIYGSPVHVEAQNLLLIGVASGEVVARRDDFGFRGSVVGLDADSGEEQWRTYLTENDETAGAGVAVWSSCGVDTERKLAFWGTGQNYEEPSSELSDSLIAVDYTSGDIEWSRQFTEDDVFTFFNNMDGPDADLGASPQLFEIDGRPVVGAADKAGRYAVFDRESGERIWMRKLTMGGPAGGVSATPAYANGVIYVNSNITKGGSGFEPYSNPMNRSVTFALDATDGGTMWEKELDFASAGGLVVANGVVYQGTGGGTVHAFDAETGEELFRDEVPHRIGGSPSVAAGKLLVPHGFIVLGNIGEVEGGLQVYGLEGGDNQVHRAGPQDAGSVDVSTCTEQLGGSTACNECACEECAAKALACATNDSCMEIRACAARESCSNFTGCYTGGNKCTEVVDENGGPTGLATVQFGELFACAQEAECPCPNSPDAGPGGTPDAGMGSTDGGS